MSIFIKTNLLKYFVASILFGIFLCASGDEFDAKANPNMIVVPAGGFGNMTKNDYRTFLLSEKFFQQPLPDGYELKKILDEFINDDVDYYPLFESLRKEIKGKSDRHSEWTPDRRLLALYRVLWTFQDKDIHKYIYTHLDTLTGTEQMLEMLNLILWYKASIFDEKAYPYFEKQIMECFNPKSLTFGDRVFLSMYLEVGVKIFEKKQFEHLVNIAVQKTMNFSFSQKKIYDSFFACLAKYAGKESASYFYEYIDNEDSAVWLLVVSEYIKRNFDDMSYQSTMQRKLSLLKDSVEELESHLNGNKEKSK